MLYLYTSTSKQCDDSQPDVPTVNDENVCPRKSDIGEFLAKREILNDTSRENLLDNVIQPEEVFTFPTKQLHCCFKSFNFKLWTKRYPFLAYSRSMDSEFCLSWALFATSLTSLFSKLPGFSKWHKSGQKTKEHNNNSTQKKICQNLKISKLDLVILI